MEEPALPTVDQRGAQGRPLRCCLLGRRDRKAARLPLLWPLVSRPLCWIQHQALTLVVLEAGSSPRQTLPRVLLAWTTRPPPPAKSSIQAGRCPWRIASRSLRPRRGPESRTGGGSPSGQHSGPSAAGTAGPPVSLARAQPPAGSLALSVSHPHTQGLAPHTPGALGCGFDGQKSP